MFSSVHVFFALLIVCVSDSNQAEEAANRAKSGHPVESGGSAEAVSTVEETPPNGVLFNVWEPLPFLVLVTIWYPKKMLDNVFPFVPVLDHLGTSGATLESSECKTADEIKKTPGEIKEGGMESPMFNGTQLDTPSHIPSREARKFQNKFVFTISRNYSQTLWSRLIK